MGLPRARIAAIGGIAHAFERRAAEWPGPEEDPMRVGPDSDGIPSEWATVASCDWARPQCVAECNSATAPPMGHLEPLYITLTSAACYVDSLCLSDSGMAVAPRFVRDTFVFGNCLGRAFRLGSLLETGGVGVSGQTP